MLCAKMYFRVMIGGPAWSRRAAGAAAASAAMAVAAAKGRVSFDDVCKIKCYMYFRQTHQGALL